jgi:excisionase family DNA binding protein
LNLRPHGPEGAQDESHGVSEGGFGSQPVEPIQEQQAPSLYPVAENGSVETPFGAPVVHELPPDPGPHERLMTVRAVAARLGLSSASVYKLCQGCELRGLRIGGALRFSPLMIDEYIARCAAGAAGPTAPA